MKLSVWLENAQQPVGTLERAPDKSLRFTYSPNAAYPISLSMPVREEPYSDAACLGYFGNLLFEGEELERVVAAHGVDRDDIGNLLYHLGADCPGAVSVTPEGTGPGKRPGRFPDDYEEISRDQMTTIVGSLHRHGRLPDTNRDPSPLAGVQPKMAVVFRNGTFYQPRDGSRAPTTHILKVSPAKDLFQSRYEATLLGFATKIGLATADTEFCSFAVGSNDVGAILSTRFDRTIEDTQISRVHSEDFCQALGLPGHLKYERKAVGQDRRFSAAAVGRLAASMAVPAQFQMAFLSQTLFNLAVGNTDNHAKNHSILYRGTHGELAPLYDAVPITIDPNWTHHLAFNIGSASWSEDVTVPALEEFMRHLGLVRPTFGPKWRDLLCRIGKEGVAYFRAEGGKHLADGIGAQMDVLQQATGLNLSLPELDYFPRPVRDQ